MTFFILFLFLFFLTVHYFSLFTRLALSHGLFLSYDSQLENPFIVSTVYNDFEMELADHMEVMGPTKSSLMTLEKFYL